MDINDLKRRAGITEDTLEESRRIKTDSETIFDILNLVTTAHQEAEFDKERMHEHLRHAEMKLNQLLQSASKGGLW